MGAPASRQSAHRAGERLPSYRVTVAEDGALLRRSDGPDERVRAALLDLVGKGARGRLPILRIAASRTGAGEHQAAHHTRSADRKRERDVPSGTMANDVGGSGVEIADELLQVGS